MGMFYGRSRGKTKHWECDEDIQPEPVILGILGIWWDIFVFTATRLQSAESKPDRNLIRINFIPAFSCVFFRESCCNTHEHILPLSIQPSSSCNPCSCEEIEVLLAQAISGNLPPFVVLPTDYNPLLYNWDKTQIIDNRWSSVDFNFRHTTNNRFSHG